MITKDKISLCEKTAEMILVASLQLEDGRLFTITRDEGAYRAESDDYDRFDFDTIGAGNSGANHFFDGIIFELAFWTKSLNATEIADVNSYLKNFHGL